MPHKPKKNLRELALKVFKSINNQFLNVSQSKVAHQEFKKTEKTKSSSVTSHMTIRGKKARKLYLWLLKCHYLDSINRKTLLIPVKL